MRAAGGEVYAVTSEPQRLADMAKESWDLNFDAIGDPHHEITGSCQDRSWLEIIVNTDTRLQDGFDDSIYSHPKGYFQPGVLALARDQRVLYRWRSVPTRKNIGGAIVRPTADYVWRQIEASLPNEDQGDAAFDENPEMDAKQIPWALFLTLALSNGWFIRPQPFPYTKNGPSVQSRMARAALRAIMFAGVWVAAFVLLPPLWVALAFAGWGLLARPGIRDFHQQFQNVKL